MSPAGAYDIYAKAWAFIYKGYINYYDVVNSLVVPSVISLKDGLLATGSGTESDPYVIQMS